MSFLAPLFLAGLAALAIPVLIHLRQRQEKKVVDFPSLMFLQDVPFQSDRRKSIKHPLLLALRLLALVLLVAAFARPFLQGEGATATGTLGPRELVVMVDRSWSMSYGDRWSEAQSRVREVVAGQGPRDRTTLVLFDDGATAPVRSSPSSDAVLREIQSARPGDRGTRFAPALRLARSILETSELPRREVVLVSDFQSAGFAGGDEVSLGSAATFTPLPVGDPEERWSNVTVAAVDLRRSRTGSRDAILPTARIIRRGSEDEGDVITASLEVDGQVRERVEATLRGGSAEVAFGPVAVEDRPQRGVVRIQGDGLERDDAHYFVLSPGREISVLLVDGARTRDDAGFFARRALELSREPPFRVDLTEGAIPADLSSRYDVVIVADRDLPVSALTSFLEDGGGLLWAPGPDAQPSDQDAGSVARVGDVRDHGRADELRIGTVDRNHPVFQPFREAGSGNFSAARFFRTRSLAPGDSARVLARFDDGSPALVEGRRGRGRILVWAGTLDTYWTDLPVQPVFLPFLHRTVLHLADRREEAPSREVGSVLAASPEGGVGGDADAPSEPRWTAVTTPSEERITLTDAGGPLLLEEVGFYQLHETEGGEDGVPLAVNVDPDEGDLGRRDLEEVVAAVASSGGGPNGGQTAGDGGLDVLATDVERHQGLWRYLLIGAFLLFVVETILSNRISATSGRVGA